MSTPILCAITELAERWNDPGEGLLFKLLSEVERGEGNYLIVERTSDPSGTRTLRRCGVTTVRTSSSSAKAADSPSTPCPDQARDELYVVFTLTDNTFTLDLEYSTDLFTSTTITSWATDLITTLRDRANR
ncbi:hypothetical protein AB0F43_26810 [Kribbella sp. NPDC023972]|uniref:hypothetical protein n=1 Tax=Kribbella sp. NPDC023972 TaxID=3154795 RepID=UPI0033F6401A